MGVKLIVAVLFLRSLGWGFVDPFLAIFLNGFADSYSGVGISVAVINIAALITLIPLIRLADKVRDTTIMRDGEVMYLFAIVFFLLASLTGNFRLLLFALAFLGAASILVVVGAETYIRRHDPGLAASVRAFSFYTTLDCLGWILGMILAAFTFKYYGLKWMFLFVIPSVLVGLSVLKRVHERGLKSVFGALRRLFYSRENFSQLVTDFGGLTRNTLFLLLLAFFDGIVVIFSFVFIPLFSEKLGLSMPEIALLMALMYAPFVLSFPIAELFMKKRRSLMIAVGLAICSFSFALMLGVTSHLWLGVLVVLKSFGQAIMRPAYNGVLTHHTPRRMLGEITGLTSICIRLGFIVGPIFSGILADKFGLQFSFLAISLIAFVLFILTIILGHSKNFDRYAKST